MIFLPGFRANKLLNHSKGKQLWKMLMANESQMRLWWNWHLPFTQVPATKLLNHYWEIKCVKHLFADEIFPLNYYFTRSEGTHEPLQRLIDTFITDWDNGMIDTHCSDAQSANELLAGWFVARRRKPPIAELTTPKVGRPVLLDVEWYAQSVQRYFRNDVRLTSPKKGRRVKSLRDRNNKVAVPVES